MEQLSFRAREILESRPPDARKRMFEPFLETSCTDCGKCCKDGASKLLILRMERGYGTIRDALAGLGSKVTETEAAITVESESGVCHLLEPGTNLCSVYALRPMVCAIFPFMPVWVEDMPWASIFALTTQCPPVAALKAQGISFLYQSDIIRLAEQIAKELDQYPPLVQAEVERAMALGALERKVVKISLLASALIELGRATKQGLVCPNETFLFDETGTEPIFPIL